MLTIRLPFGENRAHGRSTINMKEVTGLANSNTITVTET